MNTAKKRTEQANAMVREWETRGFRVDIGALRLFAVDTGDRPEYAGRPAIAVLHGYPSASLDYRNVLPVLADGHRVVLHDHPGFGLSDKPLEHSYSLIDQAECALLLWKKLGIGRIHLVAHDYGTSVATELLAQRMEGRDLPEIVSVTLSNGSIHIEMAKLRLIQKLLLHRTIGPFIAKFSNKHLYINQMRRLWSDRGKCDAAELEALWIITQSSGGSRILPKLTQYIRERYQYWDRWIGALKALDVPAHILWAQDDPVAVAAIGEQLYQEIPGAKITRMPGTGHYPMLESPSEWAGNVKIFIESLKSTGNL